MDAWVRKHKWEVVEELRRGLGFACTLHTVAGKRHWRQRRRAQMRKLYWLTIARRAA